ncbi:protein polybromo-1 [Scaptodrosophila lebanonensis]|uniref:Protein polybromo-1 n=1 Tax=Drosophila lebanonensis TaxID=7225 RepID=A0A6J2T5A0_DROLE|nr:protein polybromo-1 [Scaptodrosophila lebanonensis]
MLSRKRRASSISSRQDEDPLQLDDSTPEQSPLQQHTQSARKKRRLDPSEMCQQLYDSIRNIKKEDGATLCDTFIRAPKRRQEPSYYDVVVNPIDLLKVQQKLKTDSYDDIDDLMNDLELLISNAKAFYKADSVEYQDAIALWQHIQAQRQRILEANGFAEEEPRAKRMPRNARRLTGSTEPGGELEDDFNQYEELFASIMTATDPVNDRLMHRMFLLLPSKKVYPDYYDVIEHPIDLRLIATKIQMNAYSSLAEMERDLLQMTKNACLFNEPGSQVYKDAKAMKRIFTQRRIELETGKGKLAKRMRNLSSASIAALKEEVDSSEDEETHKKGEGPMWALFDHLYNAPGTTDHPGITGPPLGNSLWKLPVRRFHPEYFELIKRPISMSQIHNKLKKGDYANISDLTGDLYLMLDNAKKAFPATHRTHKDALKMLKIMNAKLVEESLEETSDLEEDENDDAFAANAQPEKRKPGRPRVNSNSSIPHTPINSNSPKSNRIAINAAIKKKILTIQKYLVDYSVANRRPIELFMEKPPRKVYPDYYDIIQNPIDMNTIEHNIRTDRYATVEDVVSDYRLMFSNCRQYNEEGSNIYEDANTLERALNEKLKEFPGLADVKKPIQKYTKLGRRPKTALISDRLWQFYETLREYQEPKGKRQLSLIFTKLPSKNEYPDYYDIIKEPIDMERIAQKLKQNSYESVDELAADFLLMLENACKYNEPDSQIYKDALVLQQMTLQLKQQMRTERDALPDVPLAVQELFLTLFTSLYNHQDEEGRCYSDSLAELPEYDELPEGGKLRGISLDLVKRRLDKGAYKRLDTYQEDFFSCMERARKLSRTDSDIFQDSIELQTFFIRKRDELCKETLSSPALNFTLEQLLADVEVTRQQKAAQEVQDQEEKDEFSSSGKGESMTINQQVYSPGDYVYVQMPENKIPTIACIERLWTTPANEKLMQANIFLRPHETYHVTTRKFLEMEVFKTSISQTISMDKVLGMTMVMHIKDYIKLRPDGLPEKDVFVCESRYNLQGRCFKKLKNWSSARDQSSIKFVPRETPLELKRVMSVFKERIEKHKGELEELKLQEALIEKEKPNVQCDAPPNSEDSSVYYQQYNTICSGVVKTGDFVYVATQTGKQSIAQVQQIWENQGKSYFKGPWLLPPNEISPPLGKQFYRQELLLSTVEEISPVIGIVGRCAVLEYSEFISSRPTEITESDVYICESVYDEMKKALRKLVVGNLRKFQHSAEVTQDEIFYFKTPIKPAKDVKNDLNELTILEDSMDGDPPSVNSDIATISSPAPSVNSTPLTSKVKNKTAKKCLTGYILYSSEVRKGICQSNPDASFGDISRMVGTEWKNLPASVKQSWEDRACKLNEESAALRREMDDQNCASPAPASAQDPPPILTYECQWDKCDFQFEELPDCTEHCLSEATGHIQRHPQAGVEPEYVCLWRNCPRIRKTTQAFPNSLRLIKHVREVHLNKGGKVVPVSERSKNFVPRKQKIQPQTANATTSVPNNTLSPRAANTSEAAQQQLQMQQQQQQQQQQLQQQQQQSIVLGPPPEPMFVTVPPRAQRVIHSEAYIKYIDSLQSGSHLNVANCNNGWRKALSPVTPAQLVKPQLPIHWLGPNAQANGANVVQALCHLRNYMLDDVLQIRRNCN